MRKSAIALAVGLALISGCKRREHKHVKAVHLKDNRWCYKDEKTDKWYWLEKLADAASEIDVPETGFYRTPTASLGRIPPGYGWVPARVTQIPPEEEVEEAIESNQTEDESVTTDSEGNPTSEAEADSSDSGSDGGDSGGDGGDGGGGDGGGGGD